MKQNRVKQEYKYWNDIAKSEDRDIHICDKEVTVDMCLKAIALELGNPTRILEIGCGIGRLTIPMAQIFKDSEVWGVDISDEMIKAATKNAEYKSLHNIRFIENDGRKLDIFPKGFDAVYSMITFQHIDEEGIKKYLSEIRKVMKRYGIFRFQFVQGDEHSRFSQQYHIKDMVEWLRDEHFSVLKIETNIIYKNWIWITAQKT